MKRIASLCLIFLSALMCFSQTYRFNWAAPQTLDPPYPAPDANNRYGEYIGKDIFTAGPVSLMVDDDYVMQGSQKARFLYGYNTLTVEMRAYMLSTINIMVPEDYTITEISFEESQVRDIPLAYYGPWGTFKTNRWTASAERVNEVIFDVEATITCTMTTVKVKKVEAAEDSVADIFGDEKDTMVQWLDLNGLTLDKKPSTPGIYLCRKGAAVLKVAIR